MRALVGSNNRQYVAMLAILPVVVLVLALTGCPGPPGSGPASEHTLTIASTAGGTVTSPGEGTFEYASDTVVQLAATPDEGYEFRGWTGDTGQMANRNSASTTITMNGDFSITAMFGQEGGGGGPITP